MFDNVVSIVVGLTRKSNIREKMKRAPFIPELGVSDTSITLLEEIAYRRKLGEATPEDFDKLKAQIALIHDEEARCLALAYFYLQSGMTLFETIQQIGTSLSFENRLIDKKPREKAQIFSRKMELFIRSLVEPRFAVEQVVEPMKAHAS